jgi:hypothetical protein
VSLRTRLRRALKRARKAKQTNKRSHKVLKVSRARVARLRRAINRRRRELVSDRLWGGSRYFTNRVIEIVGDRAPVTSRKRVATFGNPGSDHHVSQLLADAVDFGIENAQDLMDEVARKLGGPSDVVDFQSFTVRHPRTGRLYRAQLIAVTHGTGPHFHAGFERI